MSLQCPGLPLSFLGSTAGSNSHGLAASVVSRVLTGLKLVLGSLALKVLRTHPTFDFSALILSKCSSFILGNLCVRADRTGVGQ